MAIKQLFTIILANACVLSAPAVASTSASANDILIHRTVFHNYDHQTLNFLVTFGVGYGDANDCKIAKQRVFESSHQDGEVAKLYGKKLAKEFGPDLYSCVHENLHVIDSQYPDQSMTYSISNNGEYYTAASPNRHDVYPR